MLIVQTGDLNQSDQKDEEFRFWEHKIHLYEINQLPTTEI